MNTFEHVCTALESAHKITYPFPYFYAENVFPVDFYEKLRKYAEEKEDFVDQRFGNRRIAMGTGTFDDLEFMNQKEFLLRMLQMFPYDCQARFGGQSIQFVPDVRFIRDAQNYKIGPHTDSTSKILSLLFYLPETDEYRDYGTAVFVPKDANFTCSGGPHYPFDGFTEIWRAPFLPNSCFGFWKTANSFHGVPPIPIEIKRNLLLYNIYDAALFKVA